MEADKLQILTSLINKNTEFKEQLEHVGISLYISSSLLKSHQLLYFYFSQLYFCDVLLSRNNFLTL